MWLSAECLLDAYVVLLKKLAHAQLVPLCPSFSLCNEILETIDCELANEMFV